MPERRLLNPGPGDVPSHLLVHIGALQDHLLRGRSGARCSPVPAARAGRVGSWLVVAVRAADSVVGVSQLVLGDDDGAVVWCEDEVPFEHLGPEPPAGRGIEAAAEVGEALACRPSADLAEA